MSQLMVMLRPNLGASLPAPAQGERGNCDAHVDSQPCVRSEDVRMLEVGCAGDALQHNPGFHDSIAIEIGE